MVAAAFALLLYSPPRKDAFTRETWPEQRRKGKLKRRRAEDTQGGMSESDSDDSLRLTLSPPGSRSYTPERGESSSSEVYQQGGGGLQAGSYGAGAVADTIYQQQHEETSSTSTGARRGRRGGGSEGGGGGGGGGGRAGGGGARPKEERITPPYPWATERRAMVQSLEWMLAEGMTRVYGEVSCKKCGIHMLEVDLQSSFYRVSGYFLAHRDSMHDRAPKHWTAPQLLACQICHEPDHVRPIISAKKRTINWLFLLLTETLGICTLEQLKYFCKHTRKHRTGAKDRVLYLTYAGLLKQLNPSGPYDDSPPPDHPNI